MYKYKKIISVIISLGLLLSTSNVLAADFSDVSSSHKNYKAITYLKDKKIIEGYSDGTFRPDQKVNRAEALKIILLGSEIYVPDLQKQTIFPDVLYGTWYDKYVAKAKNLTIVKGDDATGLFRPGDNINLAEILKILLKTNNKKLINPKYNPYADVPKDAWFAPYFKYAKGAKLLDASSKENVNPAMPVTRGMMAELMYRLATTTYIEPDGEATWYGKAFDGRGTASGETFDMNALTAAHLTYPFGTWVKVTNITNGKSVVVKINDRGPYGEGRVIDLSQAAFEKIATLSSGVVEVTLEVVSAPTNNQTTTENTTTSNENTTTQNTIATTTSTTTTTTQDTTTDDNLNTSTASCSNNQIISYSSTTFFDKITLSNGLSNSALLDEVITIKGTVSANETNEDKVTAFIVDSENKQTAFIADIVNNSFLVNVKFPKSGDFKLGVLPGTSGQSNFLKIKVLKNNCLEEKEDSSLKSIKNVSVNLKDGNTVIKWDKGDYNVFRLTFAQPGYQQSYIVNNLNELIPFYKEFVNFTAPNTTVYIRGAKLTKNSILEENKITWSPSVKKNFMSTTHHEYLVNLQEISLISITNDIIANDKITAVFKAKKAIRSDAYIIPPNNKITSTTVTSTNATPSANSHNIVVFPVSDKTLEVSYTANENGLHFLEVNNADGLAVINIPVYPRGTYPLTPNPRDLASQPANNITDDYSTLQKQMFNLVNADRKKFNLKPLVLDNKLSLLAQARSDDMVKNNYFGHWDSQGNTANDIRLNYSITTFVGENLSQDISLDLAEYGLMRSAIHRSNILSEDWTRAGFGATKLSSGSYIFVQIFSTDPLNLDDVQTLRSQMLSAINKNRSSNLTLKGDLNNLAQSWSQQMKDGDFFAFTNKSGNTLVDTIRNAGINSSLGTYIMGNSSYNDVLTQLEKNTQVQDNKWENIGIGIVQDKLGIIKVTLIYTE